MTDGVGREPVGRAPRLGDLQASAARFGWGPAGMYPLIGRVIPTPRGPGELVQVLGRACRVVLPGAAAATFDYADLARLWLQREGAADADRCEGGAAACPPGPGGGSEVAPGSPGCCGRRLSFTA